MSRNLLGNTLPLPNVADWSSWDYDDYLWFFLSREGTRQRLHGSSAPLGVLDTPEKLGDFCQPIRERIQAKFDTEAPQVSIALVAYNEERQLIPTLLSYTRLDCPPRLAELIVVDNNSTDRTKEIIEACGARYVHAEEQGTPFARAAGLEAAYDEAEYLWMSDADVRILPPIKRREELDSASSTVLKTSYEYLEAHPDTVGISTGGLVEDAHWSYRLIHQGALMAGVTSKYSCWAGYNQFVRKWALEASGGIDTTVLFGEDHHRHYQLARWAKANNKKMYSANMEGGEAVADPVYISGRRYATLGRVVNHMWETLTRDHIAQGEDWKDIKHKQKLDWRHIR
jgi:glycosyltransferase involved in cell wall biosynthesis